MIRLFVAVDIPEPVQMEVKGMGSSIPGARPVPAEQLHLTLKFIGEVEGSRLLDIHDALQEIVFTKFSLRLKSVGTFPPRGRPRVLWTGVEPAEGPAALRSIIERTLAAINIPRDKKKFTPHLTLARLRNCPIHHLQQFLAGNVFFQSTEFTVERFHLYSSKLTKKGALHTIESSYQLS
ncbi:MAG: RNA 2',3'-cyclic phosphodiesterase [Desulforhopalus sp.]